MTNLPRYILEPDAKLSPAENLFLASIFIREEIKNTAFLTIQIPKYVYENLTKLEFNNYFSDSYMNQTQLWINKSKKNV
jgi:hypothetical protein